MPIQSSLRICHTSSLLVSVLANGLLLLFLLTLIKPRIQPPPPVPRIERVAATSKTVITDPPDISMETSTSHREPPRDVPAPAARPGLSAKPCRDAPRASR